MTEFVDRVLLQLSDPAQLIQLLSPATDPAHTRLLTLLGAVYDMPYAQIHDVRNLQVQGVEFERPLFDLKRTSGTWTQTVPSYSRTDVAYERREDLEPIWLDMVPELGMTLVLEFDAGEVQSILTREITGFNTLAEFRARFRFIDLDAFMAKHGLVTVDDLKQAYHYLLTEIRLRAPAPFDINNPANQYSYSLRVAILIFEAVDVAAALRAAKMARATLEHTLAFQRETGTAEVRTPYAPLLILSESTAHNITFTTIPKLQAFFAQEHILALFVTPP